MTVKLKCYVNRTNPNQPWVVGCRPWVEWIATPEDLESIFVPYKEQLDDHPDYIPGTLRVVELNDNRMLIERAFNTREGAEDYLVRIRDQSNPLVAARKQWMINKYKELGIQDRYVFENIIVDA